MNSEKLKEFLLLKPSESNSDSSKMKWWTRTQRIRTFAEISIEAAILVAGAAPIYQQIAAKAIQLQQLGMSSSAIARRFSVTNKTVVKAIAWIRRVGHWPNR